MAVKVVPAMTETRLMLLLELCLGFKDEPIEVHIDLKKYCIDL